MEGEMENYDNKIGILNHEKGNQENSLRDLRNEETNARFRYDEARRTQMTILSRIYLPKGMYAVPSACQRVRMLIWKRLERWLGSYKSRSLVWLEPTLLALGSRGCKAFPGRNRSNEKGCRRL
jgi:hypothetical protein